MPEIGLLKQQNRNLFAHSSGDWKSEIRVSPGSDSSKSSLPGLQTLFLAMCSQGREKESKLSDISSVKVSIPSRRPYPHDLI